MLVLLVLLLCSAPLVGYLLFSKGDRKLKGKYAAIGLGIAMLFFASGHFVKTAELVAMLPPWLPERELVIYATGVLEILIALALFTERWRRLGGLAAAAVFLLFLPANVYAALNYTGMGQHKTGPGYLWLRVPLQVFLFSWALWPVMSPDAKRDGIDGTALRTR